MTNTVATLAVAAILGIWSADAQVPVVQNVTLEQPEGTRVAMVTYEALDTGIATFQFKTGGVDVVHSEIVLTVTGDINQLVEAGSHTFVWNAGRDFPEQVMSNLIAEVKLWSTNAPPTYCAVNLVADSGGQFPVRWYGKESEVPFGVTNGRWKKDWLLLRKIPSTSGATVTLGSPSYEVGRHSSNEKERTVRITQPFYMGVYQVTQSQWERVGTLSNPSKWNSPSWRDERPVEQVSWHDIRSSANGNKPVAGIVWPTYGHAVGAGSFMHVLRAKTGNVIEFDLPTDAQWEYACRAGTTSAWHNGTSCTNEVSDANLDLLGRYHHNGGQILVGNKWYDPNDAAALGSVEAVTTSNATAAVGSYLPNDWGLYDMHGNVWEWCLDRFIESDPSMAGDDPVGPAEGIGSNNRVIHGAGWYAEASACRSARRVGAPMTHSDANGGFRIVAPAYVSPID